MAQGDTKSHRSLSQETKLPLRGRNWLLLGLWILLSAAVLWWLYASWRVLTSPKPLKIWERWLTPIFIALILGEILNFVIPSVLEVWRKGWLKEPKERLCWVLIGALSAMMLIYILVGGIRWLTHQPSGWEVALFFAVLPFSLWAWKQGRVCLIWLIERRMQPQSAASLFPLRLQTPFPLQAVVQIVRQDGDYGNGFIVHHDGWIVTANHVVLGSEKVWVILANRDLLEGRIIARKPEWDCALVKINPPYRLPTVRLGSSRHIKLGNEVVLVGWLPISMQLHSGWLPREGDYLWRPVTEPSVIPLKITEVSNPSGEQNFAVFSVTGSMLVGPGFSGSPIFHPETGKLLGFISWGTERWEHHDCVPVELLRQFLRQQNIRPKGHWLWQMPYIGDEKMKQRQKKRDALWSFYIGVDVIGNPVFPIPKFANLSEKITKTIDELVSLFPEFAAGWALRGWMRLLQRDEGGAEEDAIKSLDIALNWRACALLYAIAMERKDYSKAIDVARQNVSLSALQKNFSPTLRKFYVAELLNLAQALKEAGQTKEAVKVCKEVEQIEMSDRVFLIKGESLEKEGYLEEAREALQMALQMNFWNGRARFALMRVLVAIGGEENLREAIKQGLIAQGMLPQIPKGFFETLAKAYDGLGLTEKSEETRKMEEILFPQ